MSLVDPKLPDAEPTAAARPRVVALLNQKGGVGKTTSTVNLGAALARYGKRVLLVDLDPQSNLSLHFGVEPREDQPSAYDLLARSEVSVAQVLVQARTGLDFIPSVTELALVEGELAQRADMQHVLRHKLEAVRGQYDIVLLDCPPSLGVLSVNALTAADEVFVPMQAHYLPLRGLEKLLQTVHLVAQSLNPTLTVTGVLLCMHEGQSSHARAVIAEMETQLEQHRNSGLPWQNARVLRPPVRRNIKLAEAPSFGMTIFDYAPRCPGADDYRELAASLLLQWGMVVPEFDSFRPRRKRAAVESSAGSRSRSSSSRSSGSRRAKKVKKPSAWSKAAAPSKAVAPSKAKKTSKPTKLAKSRVAPKRGKASLGGGSRRARRRTAIRSGGLSL